jgi:hypothetical protein
MAPDAHAALPHPSQTIVAQLRLFAALPVAQIYRSANALVILDIESH